jgi:hypothetical protein
MSARYAVYFAPAAEHALWRAGCDWLGRDPRAGHALTPAGRAWVTAPWRYGLHATLKAPMRLAEGASEARFLAAVKALAAAHARFAMPALRVAMLTDFIALRPADELAVSHPLRRLADACVTELDAFRAPLTDAELQRQTKPHFSARQREQVLRYGYGHVLQDWRFHITLTDGLRAADAITVDALLRDARRHFAAALQAPLACDALCVFVEPAPGQPFMLAHRFPLRPV